MTKRKQYHGLHHVLKNIKHELIHAFRGVSFRWSSSFVPNLILCLGTVFIWRGMWNLIDHYGLVEDYILSNIISILIGVFLLYLPDQSFEHMGGYEHEGDEASKNDPLDDEGDSTNNKDEEKKEK